MVDNERIPHSREIEELLIRNMRADLARGGWWTRWWGRLAIAAGVVVLTGVGIAAVVILSREPVTETQVVHCMEGAFRTPGGDLSGSAASIATPEGVLDINDATALCTAMWEAGAFEPGEPLAPTRPKGTAPTTFTPCVTDEGMAAIVPGEIDCSALRLHPYQPNVPTGR